MRCDLLQPVDVHLAHHTNVLTGCEHEFLEPRSQTLLPFSQNELGRVLQLEQAGRRVDRNHLGLLHRAIPQSPRSLLLVFSRLL